MVKHKTMTYSELTNIIHKYNIPDNVQIVSDSEWESEPTEIEAIVYFKNDNIMILKQRWYWKALRENPDGIRNKLIEYYYQFSDISGLWYWHVRINNFESVIIDLTDGKTYEFSDSEVKEYIAERAEKKRKDYGYTIEEFYGDKIKRSDIYQCEEIINKIIEKNRNENITAR